MVVMARKLVYHTISTLTRTKKMHLSRHKVVCHAAKENGACTNYVSILTGTKS